MASDWAKKFEQRLKDKEMARQEAKKSFQIYQDAALKLFSHIERKVKIVEAISVVRYMVGQSETTPTAIKALKLKCSDKYIDFIPEGINLDDSKGRIRMRHKAKSLTPFIYLHLIIDQETEATYPDNLIWVYNDKNAETFEELPRFDDARIEELVESVFLE